MSCFKPPGECPICGAEVPRGAASCPTCGADERTGWEDEDTVYDGLNLPATEEEDRHFAKRKARSRQVWTWIAAILLLALAAIFLGPKP
jgi:uncharacterized membrane protein YvbJ